MQVLSAIIYKVLFIHLIIIGISLRKQELEETTQNRCCFIYIATKLDLYKSFRYLSLFLHSYRYDIKNLSCSLYLNVLFKNGSWSCTLSLVLFCFADFVVILNCDTNQKSRIMGMLIGVVRGMVLFVVGMFFALVLNFIQIQKDLTSFYAEVVDMFCTAWWVPIGCGLAAGNNLQTLTTWNIQIFKCYWF